MKHAGNGFRTWRLGKTSRADDCVCVEVVDGDEMVAMVCGKDEREALQRASIVTVSPEMYRALAGAAACLERFMLPPEQLAAIRSDEAAK